MDWTEVTVSTNTQAADLVSEALMRLGAGGTQIIDRADLPDPDQPGRYWELTDRQLIDDMPEDVRVRAWFPQGTELAALQEKLLALPALAGFDLGTLALTAGSVREEDWAECWKRFYKPFRLGRRLVVVPSWERYDRQPGDLVIELDPGLAFGTGTHETTALCAELIEKHWSGGAVLDVGTGSGILAIAAARLGAGEVLAVDVDPMAVRTARQNVAINGLSGHVEVRQGDLLAGIGGQYELAVANILADVIILLAAPMLRHLRPGGRFITGGIILDRAGDVKAALAGLGYALIDELQKGEWTALVWRAPGEA